MVLKITCIKASSGVTITDIHSKLDFEVEVVVVYSNDANVETLKMLFGSLIDHVVSLTTIDDNTWDPGSVCKQTNK